MVYESPPVGNEISCVMYGIPQHLIKNNKELSRLLLESLKGERFTVLKKIDHGFKPHGFTSLVLLAESHAAIHTYPEHDSVFFYIHSCRGPDDGIKAFEFMKKNLEPRSIDMKRRHVAVKKL